MPKLPVPHRIGEAQVEDDFSPGALDEELANRLSSFLEEAEPVLFSPGTVPDPFSESSDMHVRVGIMTDGTWVWQLAWSDYVKYHRVAPPRELVEHAASLDFTAPEVSVEEALAIAEAEGLPLPE
ncbi:hypothetical protein [Streptomyces thinghirensis]|uniref:Uncharacterized protein n=1 Tax=Streptomyces thinghirensis TaxID=551547 RepID=A0ABP9T986_9ACTN